MQTQWRHVRLDLQLKEVTEIALIQDLMIAIDSRSKLNDFRDSFTCLNSQIWKSL